MAVRDIVLLLLIPCLSASPSGRRLFLANPAVPGIKGVPGVMQRPAETATGPATVLNAQVRTDLAEVEEATEDKLEEGFEKDVRVSKRKKVWERIQKKYTQQKKKLKQWEQNRQHKKLEKKRKTAAEAKAGMQGDPALDEPTADTGSEEESLDKEVELEQKDKQWQDEVAKYKYG